MCMYLSLWVMSLVSSLFKSLLPVYRTWNTQRQEYEWYFIIVMSLLGPLTCSCANQDVIITLITTLWPCINQVANIQSLCVSHNCPIHLATYKHHPHLNWRITPQFITYYFLIRDYSCRQVAIMLLVHHQKIVFRTHEGILTVKDAWNTPSWGIFCISLGHWGVKIDI